MKRPHKQTDEISDITKRLNKMRALPTKCYLCGDVIGPVVYHQVEHEDGITRSTPFCDKMVEVEINGKRIRQKKNCWWGD